MRVLTASVTAFAVTALFDGAASACDFHHQMTVQATPTDTSTPTEATATAPSDEQVVEATAIDPALLAYLKQTATQSNEATEVAPAE